MRLAGVGGYFGRRLGDQAAFASYGRSASKSNSISSGRFFSWRCSSSSERLVLGVILAIFVASFVFSVVLTPIDPIARVLPALDPRLGARARRAHRLSRGLLARSAALSVAADRQHRRRARRRADALRLPVHERDAALSRLAGGDPNLRLRARHRPSAFASGRGRAWQSRGRFLRRDLLSALSVALAAVRIRPHLARRDPDHARLARPCGRSRVSRRAHLIG